MRVMALLAAGCVCASCLSHSDGAYALPPRLLIAEGIDGPAYAIAYGTNGRTHDTLTVRDARGIVSSLESDARTGHCLMLPPLDAGGPYSLELNSGWIGSLSIPQAGRPLVLAFVGDTHYGALTSNPIQRSRLLNSIAASGCHGFYLLGDMVNESSKRGQWQDAAREMSIRLEGIPSASILGNHDEIGGGSAAWRRLLYPALPEGRDYFIHRWPGARVIGLRLTGGIKGWNSRQEAWLRARLAEERGNNILIVLAHSFFYSSGIPGWHDDPEAIAALCPIFEEYGVDLVLSGHNHYMELLRAGGVAYALIGTGGGRPDPEPTFQSPASTWFLRKVFGWLEVTVENGEARLAFKDAEGRTLREESL